MVLKEYCKVDFVERISLVYYMFNSINIILSFLLKIVTKTIEKIVVTFDKIILTNT